jgi:TPR repeat protein
MLTRIVAAVGLAVVLSGTASAGPLEDGKSAYQSGDYATALHLLNPLAAGGDADAQYVLGCLYENGDGVRQDFAQAASWFQAAAEQGLAEAAAVLGVMYARGLRVPQDDTQAGNWLQKASAQSGTVAPVQTPDTTRISSDSPMGAAIEENAVWF